MDPPQARPRVTWIEVLVIVIVLGLMGAMLLPGIVEMVQSGHKASCLNHLHQIGLAIQNYNVTFRHFPSAGRIESSGGGKSVGGWSFLVQILPYLEYGTLYNVLNMEGDADTPEANPNREAAADTLIKEFQCPNNPNSEYLHPSAYSPHGAVTNYKAMAATHVESLNQCLGLGKPLYGDARMHPDGALFPGRGVTVDEIRDGTSNTIMVAETVDDTASLWTRPRDTVLVGLPTSGDGAVSFAEQKYQGEYFAPEGFNGRFWDHASQEVKAMRTFLNFDFRPGRADAGTYPAFDGSQPAYGPSSGHKGIVNHCFCDGSVQAISKKIDPAAYMFVITRAGGDPHRPDKPLE
jgi:type II secretory pathway pseudopilin PulG